MVFNRKSSETLSKKGFTLIELLISVAILVFILSVGPLTNISILRDYQISQEANYLVGNLRLSQYLSLYQKDDSSFGIEFLENTYLLFKKTQKGEKEIIRSHSFPKGFQLSAPPEITFGKNTGKPSWQGIIRILEPTKEGAIVHKKEININSQGNIEILK